MNAFIEERASWGNNKYMKKYSNVEGESFLKIYY